MVTAVPQIGGIMVTRKSLGLLSAAALILLIISGLIGQHRHGAVRVVAFAAWWGFVICALVLVVASVATIVRRREQRNRIS
jgi:ABC-type nickel/cobalt efflux system permease component RcnA